jgi:magnesium transporter
VVDTLTDTSNWLTSHRIQEIMRVLTILAAAFAPLAVVSGIYGMNVPLPLGGSQLGFPILMGIMILIFALLMLFFHHRRWI